MARVLETAVVDAALGAFRIIPSRPGPIASLCRPDSHAGQLGRLE